MFLERGGDARVLSWDLAEARSRVRFYGLQFSVRSAVCVRGIASRIVLYSFSLLSGSVAHVDP